MARSMFLAAVGVASLGLMVSAAQADTVFDLTSTANDGPMTWSRDGITLAVSTPTGAVTQLLGSGGGLGVSTGATSLLDAGELLVLSFAPTVDLSSVTLTFLNRGEQGEVGILGAYTDEETGDITKTFRIGATTGSVTLNEADLVSFNTFYIKALTTANGFGLAKVSATLAPDSVVPTVVPLPAAVWGGMALMGMLGANRARKRLHLA